MTRALLILTAFFLLGCGPKLQYSLPNDPDAVVSGPCKRGIRHLARAAELCPVLVEGAAQVDTLHFYTDRITVDTLIIPGDTLVFESIRVVLQPDTFGAPPRLWMEKAPVKHSIPYVSRTLTVQHPTDLIRECDCRTSRLQWVALCLFLLICVIWAGSRFLRG